MRVVESVVEMQSFAAEIRRHGKRIGLVPTMGDLHAGHLSLMRQARGQTDWLVLSIFVNPLQFGPAEDYKRYPRRLSEDRQVAEAAGVDVLFHPGVEEMYPQGFLTTIQVRGMSEHLCGASRPGHFSGVATVVAKLFNVVRPHLAYFGEKDVQQLLVIRRLVRDLNMEVEVVGMPTVRDEDGLACSSRNRYLSADQRQAALAINRSLLLARGLVAQGERSADRLKEKVRQTIETNPHNTIEYVAVCNPESLEEQTGVGDRALLALAVRVGGTRLIDNCLLP